jgi:hypothetical protein
MKSAIKSPSKQVVATLLFISVALPIAQSQAAELKPPQDGWAGWEVPAVADAPAWCCFGDGRDTHVSSSSANGSLCRLDENRYGYGTSSDGETTESVRIYAKFVDGKLARLRTLAPSCPVRIDENVQLIEVSEDSSARWLAEVLTRDVADSGRRLRSDVAAALAVHRTSIAQQTLSGVARNDARIDLRKEAVFWLAHVRGIEGAKVATSIMFEDANPRVREHAAFAVSQSKSPQKANDLIRLGNTDPKARVRSQAWFWLAHDGAPQTEDAIVEMLGKERDSRVREQGIFALSRLPDDRATPALIAVAENTTLAREERKQAVFWLAQDGSDSAMSYLDRVISVKAQR